jgi:hypothetical protein
MDGVFYMADIEVNINKCCLTKMQALTYHLTEENDNKQLCSI